ncbi:hypothetical protein L0Y46_01485 [bacterium]|nr:hypothetical protein [bacterium]
MFVFIGVFFCAPFFSLAHEADDEEELFTIRMTEEGFEPRDVTIPHGGTVVFKNEDSGGRWPASNIHPTHGAYPGSGIEKCDTEDEEGIFDACRVIAPGEAFLFVFEEAGEWRYHDHIQPNKTGIIRVKSDQGIFVRAFEFVRERLAFAWGSILSIFGKNIPGESYAYDDSIEKNSREIFSEKEALYSYTKKFGVREALERLASLEQELGDCHNSAHYLGRFAYELFDEKAFSSCSVSCHSGCYHGAIEAYFKKNGTEDIEKKLNVLCQTDDNDFLNHQCIHGIGHGLMAWAGYDIFSALESCDTLPEKKESCYSGVFMENSVGSLDEGGEHYTRYLDDSDPHYPCNALEEPYGTHCYFYQTLQMYRVLGNFGKVAKECSSLDSSYKRNLCFESMGRDVNSFAPGNLSRVVSDCMTAPRDEEKAWCFMGAAQDLFWDPAGEDEARSLCGLLSGDYLKQACYEKIIDRAFYLLDEKSLDSFCGAIGKPFNNFGACVS